MAQVEQLLVFLASPSDVSTERSYVKKVIEELNHNFAPSRGVTLRVISWETNTIPGYGMDAQALINKQIADMGEFALFVGIMWKRLGTKTPRADSGTVEEFGHAVEAHSRVGQPDIWFYFRDVELPLNERDEPEQYDKALAFREQVQSKGLPRSYKKPIEFRRMFNEQLIQWLDARQSTISQPTTVLNEKPVAQDFQDAGDNAYEDWGGTIRQIDIDFTHEWHGLLNTDLEEARILVKQALKKSMNVEKVQSETDGTLVVKTAGLVKNYIKGGRLELRASCHFKKNNLTHVTVICRPAVGFTRSTIKWWHKTYEQAGIEGLLKLEPSYLFIVMREKGHIRAFINVIKQSGKLI